MRAPCSERMARLVVSDKPGRAATRSTRQEDATSALGVRDPTSLLFHQLQVFCAFHWTDSLRTKDRTFQVEYTVQCAVPLEYSTKGTILFIRRGCCSLPVLANVCGETTTGELDCRAEYLIGQPHRLERMTCNAESLRHHTLGIVNGPYIHTCICSSARRHG